MSRAIRRHRTQRMSVKWTYWIRHVNVIFQNVVDMMNLIEILKAHYCYDALSQVLDIFLLVHYQPVHVVLITARSEDM